MASSIASNCQKHCWWFRNPKANPLGFTKTVVNNGINYVWTVFIALISSILPYHHFKKLLLQKKKRRAHQPFLSKATHESTTPLASLIAQYGGASGWMSFPIGTVHSRLTLLRIFTELSAIYTHCCRVIFGSTFTAGSFFRWFQQQQSGKQTFSHFHEILPGPSKGCWMDGKGCQFTIL